MSTDKPVHVPSNRYPEPIYPEIISPPMGDYEGDEVSLLDYWRVIVARRWVILAILSTIVAVTVIYTFKQTPIYRARAAIQIDKENQNILSFQDVYQIETSTDDTLRTQFEVLKSRTLARRVIEGLKLDQREGFKPQPPGIVNEVIKSVRNLVLPPSIPKVKESDRLRPFIDQYLARLEVAPIRQARLVNVSFESDDPELATLIINSHAEQFIKQNLQFKVQATQEASEFLEENLTTLKVQLEKSEDRLQQYSQENQILFTEDGKNTASEKLRQLEEEHIKAQTDRIHKETYFRSVKAGNTNSLPQVIENRLIGDLTARLADLQRQESDMAVTFRPEYPARQRIAGQIAQVFNSIQAEKEKVIGTIESEYSVAIDRERLLTVELDKQREVVNQINEDFIQYNIYKGEAESNKQLYDGLQKRLKEAGVSAGLTASNIRIVDRAEVPPAPIRPRKALNILLSGTIGLMIGIGFAFFQEYLDNSVKAPEDVTRHLHLPTLGMIPKLESVTGKAGYSYRKYGYGENLLPSAKAADSSNLPAEKPINVDFIVQDAPTSLMAEAYRSVRTSLLLSSAGHPPRVILVTSATPSEGKTVTAINLAISLTQTGAKVVLIDADMRKPRVHGVFSLGNATGLSSFLAGTSKLADVIHETPVPGLMVIPCGVTPPNPGELVLSAGFRKMIEALREYFDYVVLDSPPVGNVSDARILSVTSDSTIVVIKAFATSRHHAQEAITHLRNAHARIGGVVLNDVDVRRRSYYSNPSYRIYYSGYYGRSTSAKS